MTLLNTTLKVLPLVSLVGGLIYLHKISLNPPSRPSSRARLDYYLQKEFNPALRRYESVQIYNQPISIELNGPINNKLKSIIRNQTDIQMQSKIVVPDIKYELREIAYYDRKTTRPKLLFNGNRI